MLQSKKLLKFKSVKHYFLNSQDTRNLYSFVKKTDKIVFCKQIHGKTIAHIPSDLDLDQCDGMITKEGRLFLAIKTADCIPLLLYDAACPTVAAVHAGWKGLYAGIISEAIKAMEKMNSKKKDMICSIGPHIGKCCYDVSQERLKMLRDALPNYNFWQMRNGKIYIDLAKIAYKQLLQSGISTNNIDIFNICTKCNKEYDSYRRDGAGSQRMLNIIGLAA